MIDTLTIQQNRSAWLEELRSGNRQQVAGYLSCPVGDGSGGDVGFCCLGVATELSGLTPSAPDEYEAYVYYGNVDPQYLTLPVEAQDWLGVNVGDPHLAVNLDDQEDLDVTADLIGQSVLDEILGNGADYLTGAILNDAGVTFEQIADLIERFGFSAKHDVLQGAESVSLEVGA